MTRAASLIAPACLLVALAATPAVAHHSFAADFDTARPVTVTGAVTKFAWTNPHASLYIDVTDAKTGAVANWEVEMASPNGLTHDGWSRDMLKSGDVVTVEGSLGRTRSNFVKARSVVRTADGRKLGAASTEGAP